MIYDLVTEPVIVQARLGTQGPSPFMEIGGGKQGAEGVSGIRSSRGTYDALAARRVRPSFARSNLGMREGSAGFQQRAALFLKRRDPGWNDLRGQLVVDRDRLDLQLLRVCSSPFRCARRHGPVLRSPVAIPCPHGSTVMRP